MKAENMVSIIVPVYKVEKYLDECVQSLVSQTYTNLEIILVDDGSPDKSPVMCDAWAARDSRIRVIHKTNEGVSIARNTGIRMAVGKWLVFIDSDDVISDRLIEGLVSAAQQNNALAVSSVVRFRDNLPKLKSQITIQHCSKELAATRGGMYACGVLYSKELVDSIGLCFDKSLPNLEDVTWNGIYLRYVSSVVHVDVPYFYRMNPTSATSKCSDFRWQVGSWVAARSSLMNWFGDKQLTDAQRKEVTRMYRHCQNNIHAECSTGNLSYATLKELEGRDGMQFCEDFMPTAEKIARKYLPRLYFGAYKLMLRVKKRLR